MENYLVQTQAAINEYKSYRSKSAAVAWRLHPRYAGFYTKHSSYDKEEYENIGVKKVIR